MSSELYLQTSEQPNKGALAELLHFSAPPAETGNFVLLSQGKKASQSSTGFGGLAKLAVDGRTDGRWNQKLVRVKQ